MPALLLASTTVSEVLLVLKIAFLVLLYVFVWRVIRTAGRERKTTAASADSMILTPGAAAAAGLGSALRKKQKRPVELVVQRSPSLELGTGIPVDSEPITIGRGSQNSLVLDGDDFASASHARIEARGDGVWVQDLDSTNGTFVNGSRVVGAERLSPGDVLRVGETDFRIEEVP
jgi:pSer/pThr/pTyr-binding forkhead associated (FHA) protein